MPEQFLHDADVGAALEQVGGGRVPQRVGGDVADAGRRRRPVRRRCGRRGCRAGRRGRLSSNASSARRPASSGRATLEVGAQCGDGGPADRRDAFLGALAEQPDLGLCEVHPVEVEPAGLPDACPAGVEQFEQGAVTQADRRGRVRGGQQPVDLVDAQHARQVASLLGRGEQGGRVPVDHAATLQQREQAAHDAGPPGDGGAGVAAFGQRREVAAQGQQFDLAGMGDAPPGAGTAEIGGVAPVGADGVLAASAFEFEVVDEQVDRRRPGGRERRRPAATSPRRRPRAGASGLVGPVVGSVAVDAHARAWSRLPRVKATATPTGRGRGRREAVGAACASARSKAR